VQVRFIALHARQSTVRGAHCAIRQTWRYANATPNINLAGKIAVIEGNGSVEGIKHIVVPASQSFTVTFNARVERGNGPGACTSRLGVFPLTVAGLPAGIGR
jgi:hypothetical protein